MALHKDLTGADLHEPKGADSASADTLYVFDGLGSGTAQKITLDSFDLTSVQNPNTIYLSGRLDDVSTASFILISVPDDMTLQSARMTLGTGITIADSVVSFTRNDGSSFGSTVTITQSGSAEGTGFSFTATLNQDITAGGYVKITTDGASTTTAPLYVTLKLLRNL